MESKSQPYKLQISDKCRLLTFKEAAVEVLTDKLAAQNREQKHRTVIEQALRTCTALWHGDKGIKSGVECM